MQALEPFAVCYTQRCTTRRQGSFSAPQAELVMFNGYRRGVQSSGGFLCMAVLGGKLCAPDGITHDGGNLQARRTGFRVTKQSQ